MGAHATHFTIGPATLATIKVAFNKLYNHQTEKINLVESKVFEMEDFYLYRHQGKSILFDPWDQKLSRCDQE